MPTVWIPSLLRPLTGGHESVRVPGSTVRELIDALEERSQGIKTRLCDGSDLRAGLAVVIDGQVSRRGLSAEVNEDSEVHFIPAIGGG
jgi:molybdopterin synthase sulfur carrier subunit